jgi:integrase
MARALNKLSPAAIRNAKEPGLYGDGGGLWLHVGPARKDAKGKPLPPGKSWIFRFMLNGRAREMGLGPLHTVSLGLARERAAAARLMVLDGKDPIDAREEQRQRQKVDAARSMTFKQCAAAYIDAHKAGWRNTKHANQWEATLETYAYPIIGALSVRRIDTALVVKVFEQPVPAAKGHPGGKLWTARPETASRLRGRIEAILGWATVREFRAGDNPARWRGHLANLLPPKGKVAKVEHHAALPYADIGAFMTDLRAQEGVAARALEFAILTAARTGEAIGATWSEIDLIEKTWVVPAGRMKSGKEHRVPLSGRAVELLREMAKLGNSEARDYVFPGAKEEQPLSSMAFLMLLRRMKRTDVTAHGFRSTFRDWAAERSTFPSEVAEMALAHVVADKVEAAYRRGDLLQKRRQLADAWAKYCAGLAVTGNVTAINSRRAAK